MLAVEPHVKALPPALAGRARHCMPAEALAEAEVLVLLVDHDAFRDLPPAALEGRTLVDTRGAWTA